MARMSHKEAALFQVNRLLKLMLTIDNSGAGERLFCQFDIYPFTYLSAMRDALIKDIKMDREQSGQQDLLP